MKAITTTLFLLLSIITLAQSPYEKAMTKALEQMHENPQAAAQQFERISKAEKDNWIPAYYAALSNINSSWGQYPKEQTLATMEKAQEFIDIAQSLSPKNAEIMVLQGLLNTCWITYDGSIYGMKLSGPTTALYEKAYAMAPDNPRVVSNRAQWLMGSARYFNKDVSPYCSDLDKAVALFEQEKTSGFEPQWGLEGTLKAQQDCK
ncbi:tetratricopeptide repeat protein [Nonlabens ponticola]|uniref:Tetratricopeptide repeat protein n=1 Tax=Nonlabens ponticola TaxID=2496866 RepID=A0A3S9MVE7_9FLAO|nr:hypothetical protein [Nonlabens ponticola]AZQ43185.1 hypothetical protein EJ995_02650 [Nonlabens ponticola]